MNPSLLILAAGMGRRYGGLKQLDHIGPGGETILEYSVFDAIRAGFGKVVFVIRQDIEKAFKEQIGQRFSGKIEVDYVFQELDSLPEGVSLSSLRTKPWGTGHAVWVAKNHIKEPFGVINADDFYGTEAFKTLAHFLGKTNNSSAEFCLVGYRLRNTLSDHGSVSRAVCTQNDKQMLSGMEEHPRIVKTQEGPYSFGRNGQPEALSDDAIVSMNYFGFTPLLFDHLEKAFLSFLRENAGEPDAEFYIPQAIDEMIRKGVAQVKLLTTEGSWFGITHPEDKESFKKQIRQQIHQGDYPERLWNG